MKSSGLEGVDDDSERLSSVSRELAERRYPRAHGGFERASEPGRGLYRKEVEQVWEQIRKDHFARTPCFLPL